METSAQCDYQHSFKKKGEYLTLSYKFNNSPNGNDADTYYDEVKDVPFNLLHQYYDNDAHTAEHTAQIDYVNPLNDMHYIDAGMKYIFRENYSDSQYFLKNAEGEMEVVKTFPANTSRTTHSGCLRRLSAEVEKIRCKSRCTL